MSGALGLGGGAIFNPLLLNLGIPPVVASATAMYMIIYSTGASTLSYALSGSIDTQVAAWSGLWCMIATLVGMHVLNKWLKHSRRHSILVFLLCFILLLSAISVPIFGHYKI